MQSYPFLGLASLWPYPLFWRTRVLGGTIEVRRRDFSSTPILHVKDDRSLFVWFDSCLIWFIYRMPFWDSSLKLSQTPARPLPFKYYSFQVFQVTFQTLFQFHPVWDKPYSIRHVMGLIWPTWQAWYFHIQISPPFVSTGWKRWKSLFSCLSLDWIIQRNPDAGSLMSYSDDCCGEHEC